MKFFAVLSSVLAAAAAEAQLPIAAHHLATAGLYSGHHGLVAPYAAAYGQEARFAYGSPITALNAGPLTAGPVAAGPAHVAAYTATAPVIGAQYAAAYPAPAIAAPAIAAPAYAAHAIAAPAYAVNAYAAPALAAAPIVAAAPVVASSQFQAQDELGNLAYGYQNINSAKQERGNTYGGVEGSYSYVDEAGVHTVNYIADDLGFRVVGDNLPVAPVHIAVAPVYTGVAPVAVVDTPEVAEAKAAFHAAFALEAGREKRSAQYPVYAGAVAPAIPYAVAPVAPAAPSREAVLTTIKLNPGHAVFYRVD